MVHSWILGLGKWEDGGDLPILGAQGDGMEDMLVKACEECFACNHH